MRSISMIMNILKKNVFCCLALGSLLAAGSCSPKISHPAGMKKKKRDCDCPKWSMDNPAKKQVKTFMYG